MAEHRHRIGPVDLLRLVTTVLAALPDEATAQATPYSDSLLTKVRGLASAIPGPAPRALHYLKFAEWTMPLSEMVQDETAQRVPGVNVVFQIRFPNGWIMVDAGVDREVDSTFAGADVQFWQDRYDRAQRALRHANMNVVTHEHHDHVAGVVRSGTPAQVVAKTLLTRAQVRTLQERPNMPLIQLTSAAASQYPVFDYDMVHPVAPGVVLIKSPGHTPGSQMVYVRLASGREALFIGDIVWMMVGIEKRRQKPDSTSQSLREDRPALQQQIDWLHRIMSRDTIFLLPCHDARWLSSLVAHRVLRNDLDVGRP